MSPKKRLGRGLDALLSKPATEKEAVSTDDRPQRDGLRNIPVDLLQRGQYQPRVDMRQDTLENLARSIKAQGGVQPIVVRPVSGKGSEQRYEIIAGERRWRAAQLAGLDSVPAVVRPPNPHYSPVFGCGARNTAPRGAFLNSLNQRTVGTPQSLVLRNHHYPRHLERLATNADE